MSTATGCMPSVIPTRAPWHRRAWLGVAEGVRKGWGDWRRQSARADCTAALRRLPPHTLRDLGLQACVGAGPAQPRVDWEHGRWA